MLLDATSAIFSFYVLLFTGTLVVLFMGIRMFYSGVQKKDEAIMRRAKFVLMFAIVSMLCIAVVSYYITGKLPMD